MYCHPCHCLIKCTDNAVDICLCIYEQNNVIWCVNTYTAIQSCPSGSRFLISFHPSCLLSHYSSPVGDFHSSALLFSLYLHSCSLLLFWSNRQGERCHICLPVVGLVLRCSFSHSVKLLCWSREYSQSNDPLNRDSNTTSCLFFLFGLLSPLRHQ